MSSQYLNNYRGIAILLVIFSHAVTTLPSQSPFLNALAPLYGSATLLFVLVAGYFFSAMSDNYSYVPFLKSKFKQVVLPYFILSFPAALIYLLGMKATHSWVDMVWFNSLNPGLAYIFLLVTGAHLGPLWFVPMVLIYYLASPLWVFLLRKGVLLPFFFLALGLAMYLGRPANNSNFLQAAFYFLPPYLLGMWLGRNPSRLRAWTPYAAWGFVFSVLALVAVGQANLKISRLFIALIAACFLVALCLVKLNYKIKWLDLFARLSFYLFFVHGYIIAFFRVYLERFEYQGVRAIFVVIGVFFVTLAVSIAVYIPLKMLLQQRSKYILGA